MTFKSHKTLFRISAWNVYIMILFINIASLLLLLILSLLWDISFKTLNKKKSTFKKLQLYEYRTVNYIKSSWIMRATRGLFICYIIQLFLQDTNGMPTLWIGTSLGSVQTVVFNTPAHSERHAHPVVVSTCSKRIFFI